MNWDTKYGRIYQHEIFYYHGGSTITPQTLRVKVVWLDLEGGTIWYKSSNESDNKIKETALARFMSIVWK